MSDIFLSYSRKDSTHASTLTERLRASGAKVWMDVASLAGSETWSAEIVDAIKACDTFIVLLSPSSVLSTNVTKEVALASEKKKTIIPIRIEKCQMNSAMEYALAGLHQISLFDEASLARSLAKLGVGISVQASAQPHSPSEVESASFRLAVLPFEDQSPAHDNEWFSDGLTDELISTLNKLEALFVLDRKSSKMYKDAKMTVGQIGIELNVHYIVTGAVRKAGDKIRVQATLIDAGSGVTLWDEKFGGTMEDIFEIQEKTALDICQGLKLKLSKEEVAEIEERGTDNAEAYELYLRSTTPSAAGREDMLYSIELLQKAIALDPNYAAPYATIAVKCANYRRIVKHDQAILELQEESTRKAVELAPGTRFAYIAQSNLHSIRGETAEAIETAKKMVAVAPKRAMGYGVVGFMYLESRNFAEASKWIEKAIAIDPNSLNDHANLFSCYRYVHDLTGMIRTLNTAASRFEQYLALHPDDQPVRIKYIVMLESTGRQTESLSQAERLLSLPDVFGSSYYYAAAIYIRQGNLEKGIDLLRSAAEKGVFMEDDIRTDMDFWQNLLALPDYEQLLAELRDTAAQNYV